MDLVARHHADEMDAFEIQRLQVSTSCVRTSRVGDLELSEIIQLEPPCLSPAKKMNLKQTPESKLSQQPIAGNSLQCLGDRKSVV